MDGVEVLEWVGRAGHVPDLPVHLPLNARYVEEHVHPNKRVQRVQTALARIYPS